MQAVLFDLKKYGSTYQKNVSSLTGSKQVKPRLRSQKALIFEVFLKVSVNDKFDNIFKESKRFDFPGSNQYFVLFCSSWSNKYARFPTCCCLTFTAAGKKLQIQTLKLK